MSTTTSQPSQDDPAARTGIVDANKPISTSSQVVDQSNGDQQQQQQQQQLAQQAQQQAPLGKPVAGTEAWHRVRKNYHKEIERRRRENINQLIKELGQLLPHQDVSTLQTLRNAVEYIKRLKENEDNNIEKWTLEKLLTDQAVSELATSNEKLKQELEKLYREIEHWKKIASGNDKK